MNQLEAVELGRAGDFEGLRLLLEKAGYAEERICARLGLRRLADFEMEPSRRPAQTTPADATDVLIRLFLSGDFVGESVLAEHLGVPAGTLLESMAMIRRADSAGWYATVALYPVDGMLVASDRWSWPDGSAFEAPPDTVYPALVRNTRLFLDLLPREACERCLDLGSGTGIAAFAAARDGAKRSWAADIAERSTRFAEFNRRLNGLESIITLTSDLYGQLAGQTFDRIVAHAPYMPVLSAKWVFLSGGEDGEQITRRIVEGLPRHLEDGGVCCCLTMGTDRRGTDGQEVPFEARVRNWLGEAEGDFDIAFVVRKVVDPQQFALSAAPYEPRTRADAHAWRDLFARLGVISLVYGFLVIQRKRDHSRPGFTVRRVAPADFGRADWQWLLRWESAAAGRHMSALILDSPLYGARRAEFEVLHRMTDSGWDPQSYRLRIAHPFDMTCAAEPWAAQLIAQCDGQRTGRQHLQRFQEAGWIPAGVSGEEFSEAVAPLVSGGFIEVEGFRPPQATG